MNLDDIVTSDLLDELSRGSLKVRTWNMVHLVYSAILLHDKLPKTLSPLYQILSVIAKFYRYALFWRQSDMQKTGRRHFKADVLHKRDKKNQLGSLRQKRNWGGPKALTWCKYSGRLRLSIFSSFPWKWFCYLLTTYCGLYVKFRFIIAFSLICINVSIFWSKCSHGGH